MSDPKARYCKYYTIFPKSSVSIFDGNNRVLDEYGFFTRQTMGLSSYRLTPVNAGMEEYGRKQQTWVIASRAVFLFELVTSVIPQ